MKRFMENPPLATALFLIAVLLYALTRKLEGGAGSIGIAAFCAFLSILFVPSIHVDRIGQIMLGIVSMSLAAALGWVITVKTIVIPPSQIGPLSAAAGLGFFLVAVTRLFVIDAEGKDPVTAGFAFLSVLSLGSAEEGALYPLFSLSILGLLIAGMGRRDNTRRTAASSKHHRRLFPFVALTAAAICALLLFLLPIFYEAAFGLLESAYLRPQKGFGFGMALGDLNGMADSDEVVMRIRGPRTDYLRGAVYTRYDGGRWRASASDKTRPFRASHVSYRRQGETEIEFVGGDRTRFFAPLFARTIDLSPGPAWISRSGLVSMRDDEEAESIRFVTVDNSDPNDVVKGDEMLSIPKPFFARLRDIAEAWTPNDSDPLKIVKKLSSRLMRDYTYSLEATLPKGSDPVLAFLTVTKQGNCEYFASALALLARSRDIPTRVAAGYRVHDYNPIGGYYAVREKNAHAWVEAYIDGKGWRSFDPTPSLEESGGASSDMSVMSALLDATSDGLRSIGRVLSRLTAQELGIAIFLLIAVWAVIRAVRAYRDRRSAASITLTGYADPLPSLLRLLAALAEAGETRKPSEPLERFAERIRASSVLDKVGPAAADLLLRYADWRYGNIGDSASITKDIEAMLLRARATNG